jgi:MFS family permease
MMNNWPRYVHSHWLKIATLALTVICLIGMFSSEIADTDFWWHLKTGQYILQHHALPVPDPFAYTTSFHAGDEVQHFNLTHEWLAQVLLFMVYSVAGFPAVIFVRALILAGVCALAGLLAARFSKNLYAGIAAAFATASVAIEFSSDRPTLVTFLFVAIFVTLLELRIALWMLPAISLIWANAHGGFFLGWVVLIAYCAETFLRPSPDRRRLWIVSACAMAISFLNPNGFGAIPTLFKYRRSPLTATLLEWQPPSLWGSPYGFDILIFLAVIALLVSWRRVRLAHWILFVAIAAASLMAFRNILLMGFLAPVLIAAYSPWRFPRQKFWGWSAPVLLAAAIIVGIFRGSFFQFRIANWTTPAGAANFLLANHVTGPPFNTYEQGGYLIWSLFPQGRVFIDGRALNESLYQDYRQILNNDQSSADALTGARADLLNHYGIQVVLMNAFDYVSGAMYPLALALANPASTEWQLVYDDPQDLIFVRGSEASLPAFPDKLRRVLNHLDIECRTYIEHSPSTPLCARTLGDYWLRNGVKDRARRMLELYLSHASKPDPQAEQALLQLGGTPPVR